MSHPALEGAALDPATRAPLHAQLAEVLRDSIRSTRLAPGESLPSDAQLQEQFGISRSVARQAMNSLVAEGIVVRGRGRGSTVAPERQHHRLVHRAAGLSSQIGSTGAAVTTRVLSIGEEAKPAAAGVLAGQRAVRLERVRSIDGTPAAVIRTWLPLRFGQGLTADELTDASLHEIIAGRHGIRIVGGKRQVRAVAADDRLARLLDVRTGAPVLLLEGTTTASDGSVVEVFATHHRGDLIAFDIDVDERSAPAEKVSGDRLAAAEELGRKLLAELQRLRA